MHLNDKKRKHHAMRNTFLQEKGGAKRREKEGVEE